MISPVAALGRWAEEQFRELWLLAQERDDAILAEWAQERLDHLEVLAAQHHERWREANP